jgi:hypothetical protein
MINPTNQKSSQLLTLPKKPHMWLFADLVYSLTGIVYVSNFSPPCLHVFEDETLPNMFSYEQPFGSA